MLSSTFSIVTLTSIICTIYAEDSAVFTTESRINKLLFPIKLKDKTLFTYFDNNNNTIVTSFEPGFEECTIPGIISPNRYTLGNGKIVAMTFMYTHYTILDFKNCSAYAIIPVDDGKPYAWDSDNEFELVVPYEDTFDVFVKNVYECTPCRYNDKAEKLETKNTYRRESKYHDGYFLEPIKNDTGVYDKYFYGFKFTNDEGILKILDLDYKSLKEKRIDGLIVGHSSFNKTATICYVINNERSVNCTTFDADLNSITNSKMHYPYTSALSPIYEITKLPTGETMVAMKYKKWYISSDNRYDIFIQQIHADGTVEPAIEIGSFKADYVAIHNFVADSGEYCLVVGIDHNGDGDYSLLKCVIPEPAKKD